MENVVIREAKEKDIQSILDIQKEAFMSQAKLYDDFDIPPMQETYDQVKEDLKTNTILVAEINSEIAGSIRSKIDEDGAEIRRLSVDPKYQRKGIGTKLMKAIEDRNKSVQRLWLFTGSKSYDNLKLYRKLNYSLYNQVLYKNRYVLVYLEKNIK